MTVPATSRRAGPFSGNGVTVLFPFTFKLFSDDDMTVVVTDAGGVETTLMLDSGYSVLINADQDASPGGVITYPVSGVPLAGGLTLTAVGNEPYTQDLDLPSGGAFSPRALENALDRTVFQTQQLLEQLGRTIRFPVSGGASTTLPSATARAGKLFGFDVSGSPVMVAGQSGTATALSLDLASSATGLGAALLGFSPSVSYLSSTLGAAATDSRVSMLWFVTSQADRAAIKAGTSAVDHTALIQTAMTLMAGRELHFGDAGWRWNITATLNMTSGATYSGKAKIRATNSALITGAMMLGTALTSTTVQDLEFDGNAASNGANYGVWFVNGTSNLISRAYIHDTAQAGAILESENGSKVLGGRVNNCGRLLTVTGGGATDNHGVMVYSITAVVSQNCVVEGVRVSTAYRKGITTYSATPGALVGVAINDNIVDSCGLVGASGGGIFLANAPATTDQHSIALNGNICWGNYVNFQIANCRRLAGAANVSRNAIAQGIVVTSCVDTVMPGFQDSDSGTDGLMMTGCTNVTLGTFNVRRANRTAAANGAGLHFAACTFCTVSPGSVVYDETPLQKYAVLEDGASDNNDLSDITTVGAVTALWSIIGAATRYGRRDGRNTGLNVALPLNTLHVNGGVSMTEQAITIANGANQNLALPTNAGLVISNAPTAVYSIGGITGGHAGRIVDIVNYTSFAMTLNHQDAGSTAANRITCRSSVNLAIPALGSVELVYSALGGGAWFVKATG